ncbi:t family of potassium channels protein 18-like protein [Lasius niger]|uniref:T family of potassium channels protein 18-like protein n=1 Tax=Lasius niger TaxID=67767 RepID=A0A0J7JXJ5_LASNI|nr:t family of potassium channels protein 18-like protein [Lasius niger]
MPLFLLYLSNIGDILARSFKWTYARCCLCKCRRRPHHESTIDASEMPPNGDDPAEKRDQWQMVNTHGGEVDTSSLEETSPRDDDGGDEGGDEGDEEGDDGSDSYDPQHVTVPLTLCLAIMVG